MVESGVHLGMKRVSASMLRDSGFKVGFEVGFYVYDRDVVVDVVGWGEGVRVFVECESSIVRSKILDRFSLLRSLEGEKRLVLSLPVRVQAALFPWVLRLRNVVDEIWLVDAVREVVVNVIDPGVFRGGKVRGRVSVDYLSERYVLQPWKVLRFLMNDRDLVLGVGDGDCDFEIVRLDDEKRDRVLNCEIVNEVGSGQVLYDLLDRIRGICLSKARMKIFSYLLINGISSPSTIHEELDIPLSTVYREIKYLEKRRLLKTIDQLNEGLGRPAFFVMVNQSGVDHLLENIMEFYKISRPEVMYGD